MSKQQIHWPADLVAKWDIPRLLLIDDDSCPSACISRDIIRCLSSAVNQAARPSSARSVRPLVVRLELRVSNGN